MALKPIPPTYKPVAHTSPVAATVGGVNVTGVSPARAYVALNDDRVPAYVLLPTGVDKDGYPNAYRPFPTGSGTVT